MSSNSSPRQTGLKNWNNIRCLPLPPIRKYSRMERWIENTAYRTCANSNAQLRKNIGEIESDRDCRWLFKAFKTWSTLNLKPRPCSRWPNQNPTTIVGWLTMAGTSGSSHWAMEIFLYIYIYITRIKSNILSRPFKKIWVTF